MPGLARRLFDFLAKLGDVHIDGSRQRETSITPDRFFEVDGDVAEILHRDGDEVVLPRQLDFYFIPLN